MEKDVLDRIVEEKREEHTRVFAAVLYEVIELRGADIELKGECVGKFMSELSLLKITNRIGLVSNNKKPILEVIFKPYIKEEVFKKYDMKNLKIEVSELVSDSAGGYDCIAVVTLEGTQEYEVKGVHNYKLVVTNELGLPKTRYKLV